MQDGHNDYLLLTRGYLKDYKRLMDMRKGWIAEMSDTQRELASVPVAVSKYGDEPGGGALEGGKLMWKWKDLTPMGQGVVAGVALGFLVLVALG